jgi:hypothetical protein
VASERRTAASNAVVAFFAAALVDVLTVGEVKVVTIVVFCSGLVMRGVLSHETGVVVKRLAVCSDGPCVGIKCLVVDTVHALVTISLGGGVVGIAGSVAHATNRSVAVVLVGKANVVGGGRSGVGGGGRSGVRSGVGGWDNSRSLGWGKSRSLGWGKSGRLGWGKSGRLGWGKSGRLGWGKSGRLGGGFRRSLGGEVG